MYNNNLNLTAGTYTFHSPKFGDNAYIAQNDGTKILEAIAGGNDGTMSSGYDGGSGGGGGALYYSYDTTNYGRESGGNGVPGQGSNGHQGMRAEYYGGGGGGASGIGVADNHGVQAGVAGLNLSDFVGINTGVLAKGGNGSGFTSWNSNFHSGATGSAGADSTGNGGNAGLTNNGGGRGGSGIIYLIIPRILE